MLFLHFTFVKIRCSYSNKDIIIPPLWQEPSRNKYPSTWRVPRANRTTRVNEDKEVISPNISKSYLYRSDTFSRGFRFMDMVYTMTQELFVQPLFYIEQLSLSGWKTTDSTMSSSTIAVTDEVDLSLFLTCISLDSLIRRKTSLLAYYTMLYPTQKCRRFGSGFYIHFLLLRLFELFLKVSEIRIWFT